MGAIARTPIDNALIVNAALEKPVMMSELVDRFKEELPTGTRIGWLSTFAPEFAEGEDRHAFPGFDESALPCMSLHPSIDAALQGAVGVLQTHYPRLQKNRLAMTPLNGSLKEFSHTFFLEWMKHAAKMSKMVAFEAWDEMWRRLWTAAKIPLVDWATDPQQMWDTMWTEMVKEVARERNLPEVATGTTRVKMPSHVAGTAEAMSMAMSEVIRTQTLRFARKRFISSDPHGVPRADFEAILAAADAWSGDKRMEDSNVYEKRQEEHRRAASELPVDYILTPLLRIPYWKTPGPDRKNPIYTARNTNPAVPFLPTCMGKDAKGDPLEILDPTFNPYCILANVWKTPSVTIALTTWVPHPTEDGRKCAVPHALLLTKLPKPEDKLNPTPVETPAELEATMELLFVAHKLLFLLNGYTGVGCEPAYIKELWETDGAPDNVRVTWPEEFDDPNV
ncbi:Hypothetical protein, putative [Bodo saltans]|uniref:Uncharacterized protein n=1 Tax=Bodo saltans TaxID=75058 RepID=A0A0S4J5W6_BODSA|nr:Hypothetical protein, putative [Bodo saltans]|eukprot:CUG86843.1 Hypothetical protein, putative [Bodo saltans]